MIEHLDIKLRLLILASPFCLGLLSLAADAHIACSSQYAKMAKALSRSKCLSYAVALWGEKNIRSRLLVIFMITGAITFPKSSIRRGILDARDYDQLPSNLRTKLVVASWTSTIGFIWLTINYFLI
jgi:hypothetical protein